MKRLLFLLTLFVVLGMQAQQHVMTVDVSKPTARINPAMYGIFFEDINFGADGGLYAELVKNRSFEFPQPLVGWIPFGEVTVQDERPCFDRNPHYVRITNDGCLLRAGLDNEGYRGIGLKKGEDYRFSAYVRTPDTKPMKLSVELVNSNAENLLKKELEVKGSEWQKLTAVLKVSFHRCSPASACCLADGGYGRYGPHLSVPGEHLEEDVRMDCVPTSGTSPL